ncbi:hypothetical protein LSH36_167g07056 [Paralvinella palmiformis]|uniref:Uncharacterized protein n=1 Tax=Paralvinella palmiformis TaxID=53620 RepID=A0AAD9JTA0_9ANNE|nr:hypothetical protein LSH36_167g07056 [Paralvinella palmiformis]
MFKGGRPAKAVWEHFVRVETPASNQAQKRPHSQSPSPKQHTVEVVQLHMDQHNVKTSDDTKASVDEKIALLFYGCNLPFSMVNTHCGRTSLEL